MMKCFVLLQTVVNHPKHTGKYLCKVEWAASAFLACQTKTIDSVNLLTLRNKRHGVCSILIRRQRRLVFLLWRALAKSLLICFFIKHTYTHDIAISVIIGGEWIKWNVLFSPISSANMLFNIRTRIPVSYLLHLPFAHAAFTQMKSTAKKPRMYTNKKRRVNTR